MDRADRDHALDRFVAGLPVDEEELSTAVAASAVDAAIVVDALLRGLEDESPVIRARAAHRVERMIDIAPRLEARLRQLAADDDDVRTRERAAAALRAHALAVPGEAGAAPDAPGRRPLPRLWLKLVTTRGVGPVRGTKPGELRVLFSFLALDRTETPAARGRIIEQDDELRMDLVGLPESFVGHRLQVFAYVSGSSLATMFGIAETPVSESGSVSMPIAAAAYERVGDALTSLELTGLED
jgi:hypothetical protein